MLKTAKTIMYITSSTLNVIWPGIECQKMLEYSILIKLNRYWGWIRSGIKVGIKFDLIADFSK